MTNRELFDFDFRFSIGAKRVLRPTLRFLRRRFILRSGVTDVSVWLSKSDGFVLGSVYWLYSWGIRLQSAFLGSIRVSCACELWAAPTLNSSILVTKMVYELDL